MHYIEVKNLGFSWDNEPVLNDISFTVDQGEFVILTGKWRRQINFITQYTRPLSPIRVRYNF